MSIGHFYDAGGYVDRGAASPLFPVTELPATVHQYRDAERELEAAASSDVVVVSPTGFASSYALTQHPLTAIEIDTLPAELEATIDGRIDASLSAFELLQIGRREVPFSNRSLNDF